MQVAPEYSGTKHPNNMSSDKVNQKPLLSKKGLQNHGIHYIEKVHQWDELEDWIQPISHQLTRESSQPPKEKKKDFRKELREFQASGQDREEALEGTWSLEPGKTKRGLACSAQEPEIGVCQQAAGKVRHWRKRNENELKWTQFLREHIFKDFFDLPGGADLHK